MRLIDFFDLGARLHPKRVCFQHDDGSHAHSYEDVAAATHRIGNGLKVAGMGVGESFAVYSPNDARAFIALLGAVRSGGQWINLNARGTVEECIYSLNLSRCAFLFYHSQLASALPAIIAGVPTLKGVMCIDQSGEHGPDLLTWAQTQSGAVLDVSMGDEDIAARFSTGGTTGRPKAALVSNRALSAMVSGFLSKMHFDAPPTHLLAAPMSHAAGALTFPMLAVGATTVMMREAKPPQILSNISTHKVNVLFLPPTLIYMLLAQPNVRQFDYSALQYFIYAAAPMAPDKAAEAIDVFGPVMMQTFGQVEAPMVLTCLTPYEHVQALSDPTKRGRLASCGRPTHVAALEIMDEHGAVLGPGERGEIVCRGSLVMSGYSSPEEPAPAARQGWHRTGDVGYRDEDGYFYIVDRSKDMIISGGFNIYPSEIESYLLSFAEIQDCAVIGIPDMKWGEAVMAVIELKSGAQLDEQDVIARCKSKLGSIKAPKVIQVWPSLPRSAIGKVLKREIRKEFWKDSLRAV